MGLINEALAVATDRARIVFPEREPIQKILDSPVLWRAASPRILACRQKLEEFLDEELWELGPFQEAFVNFRAAIEGSKVIPCLVSFDSRRLEI